jgi:hypothetical protein
MAAMSAGITAPAGLALLGTPAEFNALWIGVVLATAALIGSLGWRLHDRTYACYTAYVLTVGAMATLRDIHPGWLAARLGEQAWVVTNLLHLVYAVFYLGFVRGYFRTAEGLPGWAAFQRGLLAAYTLPFAWTLADAFSADDLGSAWVILAFNLVNLISSLMLATQAVHDRLPGARGFLFASLPLTVSGLILVAEFLSEAKATSLAGLVGFRVGIALHLAVFGVALGLRYRGLQGEGQRRQA